MRYRVIAVLILAIGIYRPIFAEENVQENKTKGLDIVSDTTVTVLKKLNAYFTGNLEWTVPEGTDKYKKDYTIDALGQRVPNSTLKKYDAGNR